MSLLDHFGLSDYPFKLTPDLSFFYPDEHVQALLSALLFALLRGDGILKVVGEVGSGKTLLCRKLIEKLQEQKVEIGVLGATGAEDNARLSEDILRAFGVPFGAPKKKPAGRKRKASAALAEAKGTTGAKGAKKKGTKKAATDEAAEKGLEEAAEEEGQTLRPEDRLRAFLEKSHKAGRRCLLLIDEAQALGVGGLEAVRLISNLETASDKLLQIVLFGQPELNALLARHDLRQLAQRISFSFSTQGLSAGSLADYVRFRLDRVATPEAKRPFFSDEALKRLALASRGLPRIVHLLADKAMLAAYAEGVSSVGIIHVRSAIAESADLSIPPTLGERISRLLGLS